MRYLYLEFQIVIGRLYRQITRAFGKRICISNFAIGGEPISGQFIVFKALNEVPIMDCSDRTSEAQNSRDRNGYLARQVELGSFPQRYLSRFIENK